MWVITDFVIKWEKVFELRCCIGFPFHIYHTRVSLASLLLFAFDLLHTQLDRISHQTWHLAHKTRLTYQIPCSAQMSLLFNMCLLSSPLPVSVSVPVYRLNPFVFRTCIFLFSAFSLATHTQNETVEAQKSILKNFSDLQMRYKSKTNLLGISG